MRQNASTVKNKVYVGIKKLVIAYIALVVIFSSSLVLICALPSDRIKDNIAKSVAEVKTEGDYPRLGDLRESSQLDNYTDMMMLNIVFNINNRHPLRSSFIDARYESSNLKDERVAKQILTLEEQIKTKAVPNAKYPRYWHGYIVVLRPLLLFFSYSDIRKLNLLAFMLLFTALVIFLDRKFSSAIALSFTLSMVLINLQIIPLSLQFSSVFYITMISMIVLMLLPKPSFNNTTLMVFFFGVGGCTCFFDFLSAPLVTFGLPAVVVLLRTSKEESISIKSGLFCLILIGLSWLAGYFVLWSTKWVLSSILLRENIMLDGLSRVSFLAGSGTSSELDDRIPLFLQSLGRNAALFYLKTKTFRWFMFIVIPILFLVCFIFWHKKASELKLPFLLVLLALLPYLWFAFASTHSAIHYFFTYRIQAVAVMSVLCAVISCIDWHKAKHCVLKPVRSLKAKV